MIRSLMIAAATCRARTRRPAGFTLLEMLLVLAILIAFTAITFPAVDRMYGTHRIQQASSELRSKLAAARLHAIDEGRTYEFRFEPDGRHCVIFARTQTAKSFDNRDRLSSRDAMQSASWSFHAELPEQLRFGPIPGPSERLTTNELRDVEHDEELSGVSWSPPIAFAPNGRSTSVSFELRDRDSRSITISVRGLTGAASSANIQLRSDE